MSETYGWAVISRAGHIILPVVGTRVEAIAHFVYAMDASVPGPVPSNGSSLGSAQWKAWRRDKSNYGVRAIRVSIKPAFGAQP